MIVRKCFKKVYEYSPYCEIKVLGMTRKGELVFEIDAQKKWTLFLYDLDSEEVKRVRDVRAPRDAVHLYIESLTSVN